MRYLLIVLSLIFFSCNEKNTTAKQSNSAKVESALEKEVKPQIGSKSPRPKSTMSSDVLFVAGKNTSIVKGETGCMDIQVKNFNNIVSKQYSINWNPADLKFLELKDFKLKDLTTNNFGKHVAKEGKLTLSWYDQDIKGISVPEETGIFKICFEAIGSKGKKSKVMFTEDPIAVEITGPNATFLKFSSEPAYVEIK